MSTFTQKHFTVIGDSINETLMSILDHEEVTMEDRVAISTLTALTDNLASKFAADNKRFKPDEFKARALVVRA